MEFMGRSLRGTAMRRYFFDLVSQNRTQHDFRGQECPSIEDAFHMAELIAFDLELDCHGEWHGWSVRVRNSDGTQLLSVPVRSADVIGA
jgi:hypothetical protein